MPERRREQRYTLDEPADAVFRMCRDIVVRHRNGDEWIAFSRDAALIGETLVLDVELSDPHLGELHQRLSVLVIDSQPVIIDGDLRHRIRLQGGELPVLFEQQVRRG